MEYEQIIKLLDAGYTKAEIDAMQGGQPSGGEVDKGAGEEDKTAGEKQGASGAESAGEVKNDDIAATIKALSDTVNSLTSAVKAMQESNINGAKGGKPEAGSVDEVLKSFIDTI